MSGHATALAGVACLLLTLVLVFSTDLLAVFSPRTAQHAGKPIVANADPTAFQHSVQLQAALNASIYANMQMVSSFAELALQPQQRQNYWPFMGHIGQVPREVSDFAHIASQPGVRTICEIGFNAGHSASVFLTANPSATYYAFDMAVLAYSSMSMALFRATYQNRFHWIKGSSFDSVPWFRSQNITCDVFSVDGDHEYEGAITDLINVLKVVRVGSIIVADDTSNRFPGCRRAWEEVVSGGYLKDVQCGDNGPEEEMSKTPVGVKRWCWGTVAALTGPLSSKTPPKPADTSRFSSFKFDPAMPFAGYVH